MNRKEDDDLKQASEEEQMRRVRGATMIELNAIMRAYDWTQYPETVLKWVSAQKGIALTSAISAFFNGDPGRFNYLPKRDVCDEYRGVASLLDSICLRINAGFYLPDIAPLCQQDMNALESWLAHQREDLRNHRRGRWVIEPDVLDPLFASQRAALEDELRREADEQAGPVVQKERKGFSLRRIVRPLAG